VYKTVRSTAEVSTLPGAVCGMSGKQVAGQGTAAQEC
jgi:hypothetical protein